MDAKDGSSQYATMKTESESGTLEWWLAAALTVHHWFLAWPHTMVLLRIFACFPSVDPAVKDPGLLERWPPNEASFGVAISVAPLDAPLSFGVSMIP